VQPEQFVIRKVYAAIKRHILILIINANPTIHHHPCFSGAAEDITDTLRREDIRSDYQYKVDARLEAMTGIPLPMTI